MIFQSTLPAWGATRSWEDIMTGAKFQSTLPAWGATRYSGLPDEQSGFQSTLPAWGATAQGKYSTPAILISIHAPRMGSDFNSLTEASVIRIISIHAPRMGSDRRSELTRNHRGISIHAPRMGSDFQRRSRG